MSSALAPTPNRRFFARATDTALFLFFAMLCLDPIFPQTMLWPAVLVFFLHIFLATIAEGFLLGTVGTTPGKWLLGVQVRDRAGQKLSLRSAFQRSFYVWVRAWGLGIGPVHWYLMATARTRLIETGNTPWDQKLGLEVQQQAQSTARTRWGIAAVTVAALGFAGLSAAGLYVQQKAQVAEWWKSPHIAHPVLLPKGWRVEPIETAGLGPNVIGFFRSYDNEFNVLVKEELLEVAMPFEDWAESLFERAEKEVKILDRLKISDQMYGVPLLADFRFAKELNGVSTSIRLVSWSSANPRRFWSLEIQKPEGHMHMLSEDPLIENLARGLQPAP